MPSVIFCFPVLKEITPGRCWPVQLGHYPTVLTGYLLPSFCLLAQLLSRVQLFVTPLTAACQAFLSFTISQSLLKFMSIESVVLSNHLILCCSLFLLPSVFPSIRVFSSELALCIGWLKYRSFSFSINPSSEYSGLISFRIGWFDVLAVQGTLKSLLQHHSSKASVLWHSAFFWSNSHIHMTTGKKSIALTIWTFVSEVVSLFFNILSKCVLVFLPRSKRPLISWLKSHFTVILEPEKIKSVTLSTLK